MKVINEQDIINIMREEWEAKLARVIEGSGASIKVTADTDKDGKEEHLISPELKVLHKKSKYRYTVDSIGPRDVILRTPEGEKILVDKDDLEKNYEID